MGVAEGDGRSGATPKGGKGHRGEDSVVNKRNDPMKLIEPSK
jgi:hypothetical protein